MLRRILIQSSLMLVISVGAMKAQTATAAGAQAQPKDAIDVKLQDALRERDAIIRNLLERVSELERKLNIGDATPSKTEGDRVPTPSSVSSAVTSVVSTSTYDSTERQATEALDQALIVRGGLLLPSGTLEIDNTTSYFSSSSDHVTVTGFALLPVLVVGDITSQRVREDFLLPTFTARLGLPHKFQMDFRVPYGYEMIRSVDANNNQKSSSSFGLGDISASQGLRMKYRAKFAVGST